MLCSAPNNNSWTHRPLSVVPLFEDYFSLHGKIHEIFFNMLDLHSQKLSCLLKERFLQKINMPLAHALEERVKMPLRIR